MTAGRELDALVAEKVMGMTFELVGVPLGVPSDMQYSKELAITQDGKLEMIQYIPGGMGINPVPRFSTDIAAAWLVVDRIMAQFTQWQPYFQLRTCGTFYTAVFDSDEMNNPVTEDGDTAPLAICLAALKATGESHAAE